MISTGIGRKLVAGFAVAVHVPSSLAEYDDAVAGIRELDAEDERGQQAVLLRIADAGRIALDAFGRRKHLVDDQHGDHADDDADHDFDQAEAALPVIALR